MRNAPVGSPEGEAIIERVLSVVGELYLPCRAAIDRFVNPKIRGARCIGNGHQVRDLVAYALHIAELELFGSWHDCGFPMFSSVGRHDISTASPGCPNHTVVHRTDRNEQLRGAAFLRSEFGLVTLPLISCKG